MERFTGALKNMASEEPYDAESRRSPRLTRVPLSRSGRRLSFERRLRLWFYCLGLPALVLCWLALRQRSVDFTVQTITLLAFAVGWIFAVSLLTEQITRPLQTLANVVAALREDDFSFRARGARRNDSLGDLALEINALAGMLQGEASSASA